MVSFTLRLLFSEERAVGILQVEGWMDLSDVWSCSGEVENLLPQPKDLPRFFPVPTRRPATIQTAILGASKNDSAQEVTQVQSHADCLKCPPVGVAVTILWLQKSEQENSFNALYTSCTSKIHK